jgi:predicted aspartyl protease
VHSVVFGYKQIASRFVPIIPVILYGPRTSIAVEAYVDSGASFSVFSYEIAMELKLNLRDAREQYFVVGDGGSIPSKVTRIPIQIGTEKFLSNVAFSERLNIGFNLLGRQGVFEYFDEVVFNEKRKQVSFRYTTKRSSF